MSPMALSSMAANAYKRNDPDLTHNLFARESEFKGFHKCQFMCFSLFSMIFH